MLMLPLQIRSELAYKLYDETHVVWTPEERYKYWEANEGVRNQYLWLADIALKYFESIYYSF